MPRIKKPPKRGVSVGPEPKRTLAVPAVAPPVRDEPHRKKPRVRPGAAALKEIRKMQRGTQLLLRKMPFQRLVKELFVKHFAMPGQTMRWRVEALEALQVAAEDHLIRLFEEANLCAAHAKRITLMPRDIQVRHTPRVRTPFGLTAVCVIAGPPHQRTSANVPIVDIAIPKPDPKTEVATRTNQTMATSIARVCATYHKEAENELNTDEKFDWGQIKCNAAKFGGSAAATPQTSSNATRNVIGRNGGYKRSQSLSLVCSRSKEPKTIIEMLYEIGIAEDAKRNIAAFQTPSNPDFTPGFIAVVSEEILLVDPFIRDGHMNGIEVENMRFPFLSNGGAAEPFRIRYKGRVYNVKCNCGYVSGPFFSLDGLVYCL